MGVVERHLQVSIGLDYIRSLAWLGQSLLCAGVEVEHVAPTPADAIC